MKFNNIFRLLFQWVLGTPERAIDQAYRAALKIKDIEDQHFGGNQVSGEFCSYGDTVVQSFKSEVQGYLQIIKIRRAEMQVSRLFTILSNLGNFQPQLRQDDPESLTVGQAALMIDKLSFIDGVVSKYRRQDLPVAEAMAQKTLSVLKPERDQQPKERRRLSIEEVGTLNGENGKYQKATDKSGAIPRSILNAFNRIKEEIDPKAEESEEAILKKYRLSRYKTTISIKFVLLLIIVPLLAHQLSKTFIINPVLNHYFRNHEQFVFINRDFEEEAFQELRNFEEGLRFKKLIGLLPSLNAEEMEQEVTAKANEISEGFRQRGTDAIANIFSDIFSLIAFGLVIAFSRKEIAVVKSFLDGIVYNLSDSAKAFLIILFTDIFVGFHSPHGWEVVLEGMFRHFGLPENRDFNFLFIATFPVILDTVMKYWIFRYLNRISPSAVATYRNMNE